MIMAYDRPPVISYLCLVLTTALSVFVMGILTIRSRPLQPLSVVTGPRWQAGSTSSMGLS